MIGHYPGILGQGPRHRMWMDSTASTVFASTGAINYVGVYPFMAVAYYISSSLRECCGEPIRDASQFFKWRVSDSDREIQLCGYCGGSLVRCEPSEFATEDALQLTKIYDSLVGNPACLGYFSVLYNFFNSCVAYPIWQNSCDQKYCQILSSSCFAVKTRDWLLRSSRCQNQGL